MYSIAPESNENPPLPNVLVTLSTICIVDVTGIKDPGLLFETLLATLWEYDFRCPGEENIKFFSDLHPDWSTVHLSPKKMFSLCQNCPGSLKLFPYYRGYESATSKIYSKSPHWYGLSPEIVVLTICSSYDKKFLCTVHLAGAESVGMILDRIAKELQCHHYYLPNGRTVTTSQHQSEIGPSYGPAAEFFGHFYKDIGLDGSLTLFVRTCEAKAAQKKVIKQQPSINDRNIAGQVLPCIVVTIVARRRSVCTVVLTGIDDPPSIRQRIIAALRSYNYWILPEVIITQTDSSVTLSYEPLTDHGLFSLCQEQGDKLGSLKLFVEASKRVYADEYEHPLCHPLPKIVISVLDWDNKQPYFHMDMTGLTFHKVFSVLSKEVEVRTNRKILTIYGPEQYSCDSDRLFNLIQEKGAPTGSLTLFVTLQSVNEFIDVQETL